MKTDSPSEKTAPRNPASLGFHPITRWIPDLSDPAFRERYRLQRAAIAAAANDSDISWWERLQTDEGWV